jgi:hypothetical protein
MTTRARQRRLGFEHRSEPLLPTGAFLIRLGRSAGGGAILMLVSLGVGMLGYHTLEGLPWIDAFLDAAMLMGGMGPVSALHTTAGKLFAGLYSLYCGLVLILVAGILLAPIAHRLLHKFHAEAPSR